MRARCSSIAVLAVAAAMLSSGCGADEGPMRLGVLTDCQGPLRAFEEAELSGAELPLIRRGARLEGTAPTDGLTQTRVGGRQVELVRGCAETGEYTVFIEEARRLVENEHVDAIVGGNGVLIRDVARLYPDVPFVATFWDEQEITLRRPVANLYRYSIDSGQQAAGLGAYAFSELGWRRASILAGDGSPGWDSAAAFVAEFCALGGKVVDQVYRSPFTPEPAIGARAVAAAPDGVVLLVSAFDSPAEVAADLVKHLDRPSRQLLLWAPVIEDPTVLETLGRRLDGVVSTSWLPTPTTRALGDHRRRYRAAFPGLPPGFADASFVIGYSDSVEALLTALEHVGGDLSDGRRRLREELARLRLDLPRGHVSLDRNRQAVTSVPLVRLRWAEGKIRLEPVRVSQGVEQTFGGLLSHAPPPGPRSQACVKASPPPWARG